MPWMISKCREKSLCYTYITFVDDKEVVASSTFSDDVFPFVEKVLEREIKRSSL